MYEFTIILLHKIIHNYILHTNILALIPFFINIIKIIFGHFWGILYKPFLQQISVYETSLLHDFHIHICFKWKCS